MEFLRMLEGIRSPFLNKVMLLVTECGDEAVMLVIALLFFWCINKRTGYRLMLVSFVGIGVVIITKVLCNVARPFVLDPTLTPVTEALARAQDSSFPSGHSNMAAALYVGLAMHIRGKWARIGLVAAALLVAFSRMYLGVHTPTDVTVGLLIGTLSAVVLCLVQDKTEKSPRATLILESIVAALFVVSILVQQSRLPGITDEKDYTYAATSLLDTGSLLGAGIALAVCHYVDSNYVKFETKAVWWAQLLKLLLGGAIVFGVRVVLKAVLPTSAWSNALRYMVMLLFGGIVWPLTFGFFGRLGKKEA